MSARIVVVGVALAAGIGGVAGCGSGTAAKAGIVTPSSAAGGGQDACVQVRAGIAAFNEGDFEGTVAHFVKAVPLAEAAVQAHDTPAAEQLLEAVEYYAALAPEDYLAAAQTSPEFQEYKAITLGQCEAGRPSAAPSSPGLTT